MSTERTVPSVSIADRVIATQLDLLRLMRDDDTVNDTVKTDVSALSKTEQTVLVAISSFPDYSYEKLAEYCNLSRPTIARTIKTLQSQSTERTVPSVSKVLPLRSAGLVEIGSRKFLALYKTEVKLIVLTTMIQKKLGYPDKHPDKFNSHKHRKNRPFRVPAAREG